MHYCCRQHGTASHASTNPTSPPQQRLLEQEHQQQLEQEHQQQLEQEHQQQEQEEQEQQQQQQQGSRVV
jgi:hypothetical protein